MLQTEYEFTLPKGFLDEEGKLHRQGRMRLASAMDEIEAAGDLRVKANADYLSVVLLSRVVTSLAGVEQITTGMIEKLYTADFSFLQNLYETINNAEEPMIEVQCPHCGKKFTDTLNFTSGE